MEEDDDDDDDDDDISVQQCCFQEYPNTHKPQVMNLMFIEPCIILIVE
jgi:hypothetical protein